jgi:coenzyme F420-0:L-glutamate ligase / coenzyme F420-1:gamma-L-glutamate ligase
VSTEPGLRVLPVTGIGDVRAGDDLAELITAAAPWLLDGDVLVVTSKIVSKAEGRLVDVAADGPQREIDRAATLAAETTRVVASRGGTRIVQTRHGFVMANAGIDASNVDKGRLVLLPVDPDASARQLRRALRERYRLDVAVIVSDTMGRPWRLGLTDVALGAAGIGALRDYRGESDAYGNELHITQMAVVDELAAAAELVKGKYDQVPVAVVRGLPVAGGADGAGAAELIRGAEADLFSLGTAEAVALGQRTAARIEDAPAFVAHTVVDLADQLEYVGSAALRPVPAELCGKLGGPPGAQLVAAVAPADPVAAAAAGADGYRLRAACAAEGLVSAALPVPPQAADTLDLPAGQTVVALLAIGRG